MAPGLPARGLRTPGRQHVTCENCNNPFVPTNGAPRKYCSPRCKNSAGARLRKVRNAARPARRCHRCGETKPAAEFGTTHAYCRPCYNAYQRERTARLPVELKREQRRRSYAAEDPARRNANQRRGRWGLTDEDLVAMLAQQGGGCAICQATEPGGRGTWHVDHDHTCCTPGKRVCGRCIRGLLCSRCNVGLGNFRDDPQLLLGAARYLDAQVTA